MKPKQSKLNKRPNTPGRKPNRSTAGAGVRATAGRGAPGLARPSIEVMFRLRLQRLVNRWKNESGTNTRLAKKCIYSSDQKAFELIGSIKLECASDLERILHAPIKRGAK